MRNRITEIFKTKYPVIQGGMIWCSGWKLASAVSNAGGLGLIGAGSMNPDLLREHIRKCRNATKNPFGVNIPLIYPFAEEFIHIVVEEKVPIVFTSAGNPAKWTSSLKSEGITVAHVVANVKFAMKCAETGVDVVVAEGFEAGGHNGREETTTMTLIPLIRKSIDIPLVAAGGIASGRAMLAAFALGADGVQIGSRFAVSDESSAHPAFKQKIVEAGDGETLLLLKKLTPVRLLKNRFFDVVREAEFKGATEDELLALLGRGRSHRGMFEGDLEEGELEVGQVAAQIDGIKPVAEIIDEIIKEFEAAKKELLTIKF